MSIMPKLVDDLMINSDDEDPILNEGVDEDFEIPDTEVVNHLQQDEMFVKPKSKSKAPVVEPVVEPVKQSTPMVKPVKKKRVMTEEHKAKMREARKAKQLERQQMNVLERKANTKLQAKKKKELEDIVNDVPPPKPTAEIDPNIIQKAIDDAIYKHESLRQQRKAEKKAALEEEVQRRKVEEKIKSALYPPKLYHTDEGFYSKHIFNTR